MSVLLQVKKKKIGRQLTDAGKYTRKEATQSKKSFLHTFLEDTSSSNHKPIISFYFLPEPIIPFEFLSTFILPSLFHHHPHPHPHHSPPPPPPPPPPLQVSKDKQSGALETVASSGIRVLNHTNQRLEVGALSAAWAGTVISCGVLEPASSISLPSKEAKKNKTAEAATKEGGGGGASGGSSCELYLPLPLSDAMHLVLREISSEDATAPSELIHFRRSNESEWPLSQKIPLVALSSSYAVEQGKNRRMVTYTPLQQQQQQQASSSSKKTTTPLPTPQVCFGYRLTDSEGDNSNSTGLATTTSSDDDLDLEQIVANQPSDISGGNCFDASQSLLTVDLCAPFTVLNRLPCSLAFALSNKDFPFSSFPKPGEGVASGVLLPGSSARLVRCDPSSWWTESNDAGNSGDASSSSGSQQCQVLGLRMGAYHWRTTPLGTAAVKQMLKNSSGNSGGGEVATIEFREDCVPEVDGGAGRGGKVVSLCLALRETSSSSSSSSTMGGGVSRLVLDVWCKYWVLDRTCLGLSLGSKGPLTPFKTKVSGSIVADGSGLSQSLSQSSSSSSSSLSNKESGVVTLPACEAWGLGTNGMAILHSDAGKLCVALPNNTHFARPSIKAEELTRLKGSGSSGGYEVGPSLNINSDVAKVGRC
jgi:hypothetical protein